jgi:hypothetical protein
MVLTIVFVGPENAQAAVRRWVDHHNGSEGIVQKTLQGKKEDRS